MPDDSYLRREEHEEFIARMDSERKRLEDENNRQNHRIEQLEASNKEINNLALNIQELTYSINSIAKETERLSTMMEKNIKDIDVRLTKIESRDGERWRDITKYIITAIIGVVIGFIFRNIGM